MNGAFQLGPKGASNFWSPVCGIWNIPNMCRSILALMKYIMVVGWSKDADSLKFYGNVIQVRIEHAKEGQYLVMQGSVAEEGDVAIATENIKHFDLVDLL